MIGRPRKPNAYFNKRGRLRHSARHVHRFSLLLALAVASLRTYPVLLADAARVLQVASPRQSQCAHLEVAVGEHVRQAECVVVLFCERPTGLGVVGGGQL